MCFVYLIIGPVFKYNVLGLILVESINKSYLSYMHHVCIGKFSHILSIVNSYMVKGFYFIYYFYSCHMVLSNLTFIVSLVWDSLISSYILSCSCHLPPKLTFIPTVQSIMHVRWVKWREQKYLFFIKREGKMEGTNIYFLLIMKSLS